MERHQLLQSGMIQRKAGGRHRTVSFIYLWQAFKEHPLISKVASKPTNHLAVNRQGQSRRGLGRHGVPGMRRLSWAETPALQGPSWLCLHTVCPSHFELGQPPVHTMIFFIPHIYSSSGTSQVALMTKNPPANAGDKRYAGLIPGSGRSPGEGNGNPLQYFCWKIPMDRGGWPATVHRVAKSGTRLK